MVIFKKQPFVAFPFEVTSTGPGVGGMILCLVYDGSTQKAQPKVVLWRSRESNLRPPGLQGIGLSPTPRQLILRIFTDIETFEYAIFILKHAYLYATVLLKACGQETLSTVEF